MSRAAIAPALTIPSPRLDGGVSRQPPHLRFPNQVGDGSQNVVFSVVDGMSQRAGTLFGSQFAGSLLTHRYRLHGIYRDQDEQYLVAYCGARDNNPGADDDAEIRVFRTSDWAEATVTISADAQTYLNHLFAGADKIRMLTIKDTTFITNALRPTEAYDNSGTADYTVQAVYDSWDIMASYGPNANTYFQCLAGGSSEFGTAAKTAGYYRHTTTGSTFCRWSGADVAQPEWNDPQGQWKSESGGVGAIVHIKRRALVITGLAWNATTDRLSKVGAFAGYTHEDGDYIALTGGNEVDPPNDPIQHANQVYSPPSAETVGYYEILSKIDDDKVQLADDALGSVDANGIDASSISQVFVISEDFAADIATDNYEVALRCQKSMRSGTARDDILCNWLPNQTGGGKFQIFSPWKGDTYIAEMIDIYAPDTSEYDLSQSGAPFEFSAGTSFASNGTTDPTKAIDERWASQAPPGGDASTINPTTMPIAMTRTSVSPLEFDVDVWAWKARESGTNQTNPPPALIANMRPVADLLALDNRLCLGGDENIAMTAAGDFEQLFLEDPANPTDADPIDFTIGGDRVGLIDFMVSFRRNVSIFTTSGVQLELAIPDTGITPTDISIEQTTTFDTVQDLRPMPLGNLLYFVSETVNDSQLREMYFDDLRASTTAQDVTKHTPRYIPTSVASLATSDTNGFIALVPRLTNEVYTYQTHFDGAEKQQGAVCKWVFPDNYKIHDAVVIESQMFMLIEGDTRMWFEYVPISREVPQTDWSIPVHLDRRYVIASGSYSAGPDETTFTLPQNDGGLTSVVLGPDFGAAEGTVLSLKSQTGTTVVLDGDYSAGEVQIGVDYLAKGELTRPYARDERGLTNLGAAVQISQIVTHHAETSYYELVVTYTHGSSTRTEVFDAGVAATEAYGVKRSFLTGPAELIESIVIQSSKPRPFRISALEFVAEITQGVGG